MVIDLGVDVHRIAREEIAGEVVDVVVAQDLAGGERAVRVGIRAAAVAEAGVERAAVAVRLGHGLVPVRRIAAPVPTQATRHLALGEVEVVGLRRARGIGERRQARPVEVPHGLAVELLGRRLVVRGLVVPQVRRGAGTGQVHREAVVLARVEARVGTTVLVAAHRLRDATAHFLERIVRGVGDGATEVAGGRRTQVADAFGELGAAEVLGDQRAIDRKAVVVVVRAVAERHAVERVAQARAAEATQAQRHRLFVGAERVDRLRVHARQHIEYFLKARARRKRLLVGGAQALHLAGLAGTDHRDGVEILGLVTARRGRRIGGGDGIGVRGVSGGGEGHTEGGGQNGLLEHELRPYMIGRVAAYLP